MNASKRFLRTVIIYIRVYFKEKLNKYSLDSQEKACLDYALENGYRVLKVFKEENISAKSFNRPQFQAMIDYIKSNKWKIKFLIVSDVQRLSTDSAGLQRLRHFLRLNGIKLISISQSMLKYTDKQAKQAH